MQNNENHNSRSDHSAIKLQLRIKKPTKSHRTILKVNNLLLKDDWINNEMKAEIEIFFETNEKEDRMYQNLWTHLKQYLEGNL